MGEREVLATITDVRLRIRELVEQLADRDVLVLKHGHPVAVMLGHRKYETLLAYIDELEDRLSVHEARTEPKDMRIPWEKAEAGLVGDSPRFFASLTESYAVGEAKKICGLRFRAAP